MEDLTLDEMDEIEAMVADQEYWGEVEKAEAGYEMDTLEWMED